MSSWEPAVLDCERESSCPFRPDPDRILKWSQIVEGADWAEGHTSPCMNFMHWASSLAENGYVLPQYPVSHWVGLLDSEPFGAYTKLCL